jgi:hypothetical protein
VGRLDYPRVDAGAGLAGQPRLCQHAGMS